MSRLTLDSRSSCFSLRVGITELDLYTTQLDLCILPKLDLYTIVAVIVYYCRWTCVLPQLNLYTITAGLVHYHSWTCVLSQLDLCTNTAGLVYHNWTFDFLFWNKFSKLPRLGNHSLCSQVGWGFLMLLPQPPGCCGVVGGCQQSWSKHQLHKASCIFFFCYEPAAYCQNGKAHVLAGCKALILRNIHIGLRQSL